MDGGACHDTPLVEDPDRFGPVDQLGSMRRRDLRANGHHSTLYLTGLVDLERSVLIDPVEGNSAADLREWVNQQGRECLGGITTVATDLAESPTGRARQRTPRRHRPGGRTGGLDVIAILLAMSMVASDTHCNDLGHKGTELMVRQLPPVDDEVFEALQHLAEPLVDDVNSVLRRLLGIGDSGTVVPDSPSLAPGAQTRARSRQASTRSATKERASSKNKKATTRPRAARGSLLPEREYEEPLLRALVARGGSAAASELIEDLGEALDGRLTPVDREILDSGLVRWKNRVQFVRLKLVQAGQVKKDSPRGIWEITPAGRDRVEDSSSSE